jgi:mono/diheme cytochrome c family protein
MTLSYVEKVMLLFVVPILLLLVSCSGLAGEPEIIATLPPETPRPQEAGYPLQAPDLALGAQIFAENCTACHGIGGRGDGESVTTGKVPAPPDFTNPATSSGQKPSEWFTTITDGRMDKLMPPWGDILTEEQRWVVALYTYTMPYSPQVLEFGKQVWEGNCAECHGVGGSGDGPKAAEINRPLIDLTLQSEMVGLSDQNFYNIITEGTGEMPAFADTLDENARRAVAAYTRSLGLANLNIIGQKIELEATPEVGATADVMQGTVTGRVSNGTAASTVPPGLAVRLFIVQNQSADTRDTTIQADGTFRFENVPIQENTGYIAATNYRERTYYSELVVGDPAAPAVELPITVYELTQDTEVVTITNVDVRIAPVDLQNIGGGLEILQVITYHNNSDRAFSTDRAAGQQGYASLLILLPPGSVILGTDNPNRYVPYQEGFALIDTAPVLPGENQVQVTYFLPYEDGAIVEQEVNNDFNGKMRVLLYPERLKITSDTLQLTGEERSEGRVYQVYEGNVSVSRGSAIRYDLSGQAVIRVDETASTATTLLPLLLVVVGGVLLLVAIALYTRSRRAIAGVDRNRLIDALVRQIAELDEAHDAGQMNHDLYQRQRQRLKARLGELMDEDVES